MPRLDLAQTASADVEIPLQNHGRGQAVPGAPAFVPPYAAFNYDAFRRDGRKAFVPEFHGHREGGPQPFGKGFRLPGRGAARTVHVAGPPYNDTHDAVA